MLANILRILSQSLNGRRLFRFSTRLQYFIP